MRSRMEIIFYICILSLFSITFLLVARSKTLVPVSTQPSQRFFASSTKTVGQDNLRFTNASFLQAVIAIPSITVNHRERYDPVKTKNTQGQFPSCQNGKQVKFAEHKKFFAHGGNSQRFAQQKLPGMKIFVDVGSYYGDDILSLAKNNNQLSIHLYEPVPSFYHTLSDRMKQFSNVIPHNVGIGSETKRICFQIRGDGTSAVDGSVCPSTAQIGLVTKPELLFANFSRIDVLQLNCEGCEFLVIPAILNSTETIMKIRYLEVQFHCGKAVGYCELVESLSAWFTVKYNHECVWMRMENRYWNNVAA